ncbi:caspase family protein [Methylopila sp. M107]|uniref:caspase family protein n=1 Tax=Methylopila sp. M107 TaxID=1101190 RepID=UPI00037EF62F|nr:caspase family protein [Methylopila sp. M107]
MRIRFAASALVLLAALTAPVRAASDMETCADDDLKKSVFELAKLAAAEAACGRALLGAATDEDRQKAVFYRGLTRFLLVVQKGAAAAMKGGDYAPPSPAEVRPALADIEAAAALEGPMKTAALAMRVTIKQATGQEAEAKSDVEQAVKAGPKEATPLVMRALQHEMAGDGEAALADLNRAVELEPKLGTALTQRGELLQRLGELTLARADYAAAAALGAPFARHALTAKSEIELRAGDLQAAYDDLLAAARSQGDLPKAQLAEENARLLVRAGDLALDKLKDEGAAEKHFRDAERLFPNNWNATLGLARLEEARGQLERAKAIYRRVVAGAKGPAQLYERMSATARLALLGLPAAGASVGPFRDTSLTGTAQAKGSPDGLKRAAFIIGAGDYEKLASLPNARRDAAVMANALAEMGFDSVMIAENLGRDGLRAAPAAIAERAPQSDVVLVFYAGHAVEADGINYLIPVDARPESDRELQSGALALADVTAAAAKAKRGSLVIVDACRDDPFVEARAVAAARGGAKAPDAKRLHAGLAATRAAAPNSVVLHSTQAGQPALDGDGLDSPFVRGLLATLATPGKSFDTVVRETTKRVSDSTDARQVPASYGAPPAVALLPPARRR